MTSGWLNHKALQIIKGVGKTPADTNSAEIDPVVVNLLSGLFTLDQDGWSPAIPDTKNGGVWADSPISDGRQLLAAPANNVTEKMTINISDSSYLGVMRAYSALNKMVLDCRAYWESRVQIDPVYLMWSAGCNNPPLPQYALIYNIDLAPEYVDSPTPTMQISMTLERESWWRGIPPGANPKLWTYYVNTSHPQFNSGVSTLATLSDHLITQTIQNKFEWTPTAFGLQTTPITQNYIDISAALVPGDAPALVEMSITSDVENPVNLYIGLSSKDQSQLSHDGTTHYNSYILNAGDAAVVTAVKTNTGSSTTGVRSNGSAVNFFDVVRTVTGIDANPVIFAEWGTGLIKLDRQLMRGTFAIFCRCSNNSGTPTLGDMRIRVNFSENESGLGNSNIINGQWVNPPVIGTARQLTYMGTITIPFSDRAVTSSLGYGIQIQNSNSNMYIILEQQVLVATANRILEVTDLILMPLDEGLCSIVDNGAQINASAVSVLDNTGYSTHGELQQVGYNYFVNSDAGGVSQEVRGDNLYLKPRTDQRLYFIADSWNGASVFSRLTQTFGIRLNIIPRWSGIRDT